MPPSGEIRAACAAVAARAEHVRLASGRVTAYARQLERLPSHPPPSVTPAVASPEARAAFHLAADAINFGSGWFPTCASATAARGRSP